ncbi:MAG: hypothetical protein V1798_05860 [Pseudomonadota bacterium]
MQFSRSIQEVLGQVQDQCEASGTCVVIVNPGGTSGIDTDGDGTPDVIVIITATPTPLPTQPGSTPTPTPTPFIRSGADCVFGIGSTKYLPVRSGTINVHDEVGASFTNFLVNGFNSGTTTYDFSNVTVDRIIVNSHTGNGSRINFSNAAMSVGYCNEGLAGQGNIEFLDGTCSAQIVDLDSGTGGNNSLEIDFVPSFGLRYSVAGNNQCISFPDGTNVLSADMANENGHVIHEDGASCF